jgi:adenine-specific DNA-methyltransferase
MVSDQVIPHIIKYMGSKRNLIDFVVDAIQELDPSCEKRLYDVFAGSSVVSGAFRNIRPITCNDIQSYSSVIGEIYLQNYHWDKLPETIIPDLVNDINSECKRVYDNFSDYLVDYNDESLTLDCMSNKESTHREFIDKEFEGFNHLFIQKFSGTYWSLNQCIEIDSIYTILNKKKYKKPFLNNLAYGALMFSMAYCSQSTGHYAQYRDLNKDNINDILIYRRKSIVELFNQKINSLSEYFDGNNNSDLNHITTNMDYLDSILAAKKGSIIYADPPYQFVHYSRFYHALETLVKYDYPEVKYKGRYRTDRHQSPFCIRTKVRDAFRSMFESVVSRKCSLVLSYSDNGMISMEELIEIAESVSKKYFISIKSMDYLHSTMGRQKDKYREVKEVLLIFTKK